MYKVDIERSGEYCNEDVFGMVDVLKTIQQCTVAITKHRADPAAGTLGR